MLDCKHPAKYVNEITHEIVLHGITRYRVVIATRHCIACVLSWWSIRQSFGQLFNRQSSHYLSSLPSKQAVTNSVVDSKVERWNIHIPFKHQDPQMIVIRFSM